MKLDSLIIDGISVLGFNTGMSKSEMEEVLGESFGESYIETEDLTCYLWERDNGVLWAIYFDKKDVCFEIKLNFDENTLPEFSIELKGQRKIISNKTTFEEIVETLHCLKLDWRFDVKRMYLQTACIHLPSGGRLYFAFGNKEDGDYGLFSLSFILESHEFNLR